MPPVELAYEHYGEQHSGCPLIILHGFFGSSRNWRAIAQRLAADYPVYVLDMRNHGLSPHAPEMDYPSMAEDLAFFMERLNLSRAHILGHSMGGKIAMWFALQQPERVENLLIADISPVSYAHSFENLIQALKNLPLHELGNRKQADIWLEPYISESPYRQFLLQNLAFQDGNYYWRVNLDYFLDNAGFIAAFPELENIQPYPKPVLFLAGETSDYIDKDALYHLFPNSVVLTIPGAGHWLHTQAPQQFYQAVIDWLNPAPTTPADF